MKRTGNSLDKKKWLIAFISLACALFIASAVILGVFLAHKKEEAPAGSGDSVVTGIYGRFNTEYETVKGNETLRVYRLKTGETYEFYVSFSFRGSKYVMLGKGGVEIYYDTRLLAFDEGEYWDDPDRDATPTDDFPFYFTCCDMPAYTEIFVVANGFWCKVAVIIEN